MLQALKANKEFAKWLEQWVERLQGSQGFTPSRPAENETSREEKAKSEIAVVSK